MCKPYGVWWIVWGSVCMLQACLHRPGAGKGWKESLCCDAGRIDGILRWRSSLICTGPIGTTPPPQRVLVGNMMIFHWYCVCSMFKMFSLFSQDKPFKNFTTVYFTLQCVRNMDHWWEPWICKNNPFPHFLTPQKPSETQKPWYFAGDISRWPQEGGGELTYKVPPLCSSVGDIIVGSSRVGW